MEKEDLEINNKTEVNKADGNAAKESNMRKSSLKWFISIIACLLACCILIAGFQAVVDPYFHFHKPLANLYYKIDNERYQNDGIVKNFDYDALIAGSSMTENFKTSEMDELFGVTSVKTPFAGGSYKEVDELVRTAISHNDDIKIVVRGLDFNRFFNSKDDKDYDDYPSYLYDDNPFNDISYVLNINVLLVSVQNVIESLHKNPGYTSFDEYANWNSYYAFGKNAVENNYARSTVEPAAEQYTISDEEYIKISENIQQNVIDTAVENPDIDFYYFITPYSICYFDYYRLTGELDRQLTAEKYIIEMLLPYENIHVFSFFTETDIITNLDNYRDVAHYGEAVNSYILQCMKDGKNEITSDNYEDYCEWEWDYFHDFDYDEYFADWSN